MFLRSKRKILNHIKTSQLPISVVFLHSLREIGGSRKRPPPHPKICALKSRSTGSPVHLIRVIKKIYTATCKNTKHLHKWHYILLFTATLLFIKNIVHVLKPSYSLRWIEAFIPKILRVKNKMSYIYLLLLF